MSNPIAVPGSVVQSGAFVTPGGAQGVQGLTGTQGPTGPQAVSTDANNIAVLGSDSRIYVPSQTSNITSIRLRSYNAIGNPNFEVDQRNVGNALTTGGSSIFIQDRWSIASNCATLRISSGQAAGANVVPGTSFQISNNYIYATLTTQQTTLAAGEFCFFTQTIEGPRLRELIGDAHSLSLILYTSVVGGLKVAVTLRDPGAARSLVKLVTIPYNAFTLISLPNLPIWPGGGNFSLLPGNAGYLLGIGFACGSTYIAPALDTWQNGNFIGAPGMDNFGAKAVNASVGIAFVQHEPGPLCTTLIDCPFGQNLDGDMGCLRYFQKSYDYAVKPPTSGAAGNQAFFPLQSGTTTWIGGHLKFPKLLAKDSTVTIYANDGTLNAVTVFGGANTGINSANTGSNQNGIISMNLSTGQANAAYQFHYTADTGW